MADLCSLNARTLVAMMCAREVSVRDVMGAHLERIHQLNPAINAIVAMLPDEECLQLAEAAQRRLDGELAAGRVPPALFGLPVAFKDTEPAVGFPQSQGSPIFRDFMPALDSIVVERIRRAGAIPIGKTNVPEFAMGSHTYNRVYGPTRNPFDLRLSAGGSTGGGAAAVTTGMLALADGSDLGGSLRNPASFNNVVGFRPSVGLVPLGPGALPYGFGVKGPIARSVDDAALMLSVMAGADPRDPATYPSDPARLASVDACDLRRLRIAWALDLGGLPLDARVRAALEPMRHVIESFGCAVDDACPDLADAEQIFLTIRRWRSWHTLGPLLQTHRSEMKPEAIEEIEAGARVTGMDVANAMARHVDLMARMALFQERYEVLVCAVSQVPPFDIDIAWPREIAGVGMESYVAWMKSAYLISATWCPSIALPAAFTSDGLPVGLQCVGRYREDARLLSFAKAIEERHPTGRIRPNPAPIAASISQPKTG
jgi:amidase